MPESTPRKLSETRIRILRRLAERDLSRECAETAREIAVALGIPNTGAVIMTLASEGLVKRLGVGDRNASTWTATEAGRAALAQAEGR